MKPRPRFFAHLLATRLLGRAVCLALAATGAAAFAAGAAAQPAPALAAPHAPANFHHESAAPATRSVADWVVAANDNGGLPFLIVDKKNARVFVFDAAGVLIAAAPALLGLAPGDDATPGIGERALATILPAERTTPAGRFVAALDRNLHGEEILWIDYDTGIALHRVVTTSPRERRAERLATATADDNRITFGCINVPKRFFEEVVAPAFKAAGGIAYVLPETRPVEVYSGADGSEKRRF